MDIQVPSLTLRLNFNFQGMRSQISKNDLKDVQANILKPHGREHAWCIFIQFMPGNPAVVQDWVRQFSQDVTSAQRQQDQKVVPRNGSPMDKGTLTCLFLSAKGYGKLGFPIEGMPQDPSFLLGMRHGKVNSKLSDLPSGYWEANYQRDLDAMILIANDDVNEIKQRFEEIIEELSMAKAGEYLYTEKGETLPRLRHGEKPESRKRVVEHFGFLDGISNPKFLDKDGNFTEEDTNMVLDTDTLGSYLVFRKLEQNVWSFNRQVKRLAKDLEISQELAEAQVIGRFKIDGKPLIIGQVDSLESNFDFQNDDDGRTCPFHAHIRKTNPRNERSLLNVGPNVGRIVRRGMTYDYSKNKRNDDLSDQPRKNVGLLFMCCQSSIEQQFEQIQAGWCNNKLFISPNILKQGVTGIDPIVGQYNSGRQMQNWNAQGSSKRRSFSNVVKLLGGEYFYAPPKSFLENPTPDPKKFPREIADKPTDSSPGYPGTGYYTSGSYRPG